MRYGADRARLLADPINFENNEEFYKEHQFNKDNIDPDVIAATTIGDHTDETEKKVCPNHYSVEIRSNSSLAHFNTYP